MARMNEVSLEEEQAIRNRCKTFNRGWYEGGLTMYECPVCLKHFCVSDQHGWAYKRRPIGSKNKCLTAMYLCSYGCSRKFDRIFDK